MKRMTLDLLISLDRTSDAAEGLTRQIYAQLRQAMLSGRLRAGDRLPPSRALAQELGVARLTVATAYDWLRAEGYVAGRVGAGTFVAPVFEGYAPAERAEVESDHASAAAPATSDSAPASEAPRHPPLTAWAERIQRITLMGVGIGGDGGAGGEFDFRPSVGAADLFPWARWRRIVAWQDTADPLAEYRTQARESAARAGRWDALLGPLETRAAIAAWLRRSRAAPCEPDQLLIASSVQQVLALLARLLVEPGRRLLVEDPSYIGFHAAFLAEGARLQGVPVDHSGIRVDALPEALGGVADDGAADVARLLIVTPSHQYPTGVTLALERRMALIEWARRAGVTLVEDDYDGDLRLEGQPLEALRGLDERDEVIYLGTFAKALYPAARLSFAVLPRWLVEPVARARAASDRHPAWRDALAIARFIEAGELERHLARMRRVYRARRDALVAALRAELGDTLRIGPAEAGIHLLATLPDGIDDVALVERARAERGLAIAALSPHYQRQPRPGMLLGFGAQNEERLAEGVRRLAPLVRATVADTPR